jgi:hypothetical protein
MARYNLTCQKCGKVVGTHDVSGIRHTCAVTPPPVVVPPPVDPPPVVPPPVEPPPITPPPTGSVFNAKDYGATGNGSSDDAPAIRKAINAAFGAGGGIVYLPTGTYRMASCLPSAADYIPGAEGGNLELGTFNVIVRDHVHIAGDGIGKTIVVGAMANAHPFGGDHNHDIGVADMSIKGAASSVDGTKFMQCDGVTIENVDASNLYIGLALYSCTNSIIRKSKASGCSGFGFGIGEADTLGYSGRTDNVLLEDCVAANCAVSFRVRSVMKVANSPYTRRSDFPYYGGNCRFVRCAGSGASAAGFWMTDSHNVTADGCSHAAMGNKQEWYFGNTSDTVFANCTGGSAPQYLTTSSGNYGYMPACANNLFNGVKKN